MMDRNNRQQLIPILLLLLILAGCSLSGSKEFRKTQAKPTVTGPPSDPPKVETEIPGMLPVPTETLVPTGTSIPNPTEVIFEVGKELTITYLRELEIEGSEIVFQERLSPGWNYQRHVVSYTSDGNKIYGLLTIPIGDPPEGGFKAIVFNHGYIPPDIYRTTERYLAYVDYLARSGFVVFKIDYRGNGNSEGVPSGSYFSPGYTIDAISALKSLQELDYVDPDGIGMWGHSMAGNLVLRAMLIEPEIQAGVIWAGAVYSYDDFLTYGINDRTYRPPARPDDFEENEHLSNARRVFETYGWPNLDELYWQAVSLTKNIQYLENPLQLHHAEDDSVVTINYSHNLAAVLLGNEKEYEFYIYDGGGHNLISPWFDQAMQRTVQFFEDNL